MSAGRSRNDLVDDLMAEWAGVGGERGQRCANVATSDPDEHGGLIGAADQLGDELVQWRGDRVGWPAEDLGEPDGHGARRAPIVGRQRMARLPAVGALVAAVVAGAGSTDGVVTVQAD